MIRDGAISCLGPSRHSSCATPIVPFSLSGQKAANVGDRFDVLVCLQAKPKTIASVALLKRPDNILTLSKEMEIGTLRHKVPVVTCFQTSDKGWAK